MLRAVLRFIKKIVTKLLTRPSVERTKEPTMTTDERTNHLNERINHATANLNAARDALKDLTLEDLTFLNVEAEMTMSDVFATLGSLKENLEELRPCDDEEEEYEDKQTEG
jgi:hypothetical protein